MARIRLKDLRGLSVAVVHPPDANGQTILDQLRRIGCRTDLVWPPEKGLPSKVDVVFAGIYFDSQEQLKAMLRRAEKPAPAIIAVVDYENPAMLELVLDLGAVAVTSKPVRSFGIMTNMVVARECQQRQYDLQDRISKLEKKLAGQKVISKAKSILMEMHGISEAEAFETIRKQAMSKRTSIEDMAQAIINANELLSAKSTDI
ncbi:ANTAR domain-containing protein [Pseudooceanicola sp. 216_PA32_1]|uniref:ANTAR domain-containing protein n=1 Tax=Pseudooceanicola pacificus TaxID=2676438 RepID=A0A844W100_9RHOB|nr:ANTAR domain-containing protein [Pseudooceanicola pacificus]MWB77417.1 ANTAR domain-containing protein [Pseudooceanicola pacificus]